MRGKEREERGGEEGRKIIL